MALSLMAAEKEFWLAATFIDSMFGIGYDSLNLFGIPGARCALLG